MNALLETHLLSKSYDKRTVLRDISLSIEGGSLVALLGHNGAGKTTLMKLLLGLTRPDSGHISLLGSDPQSTQGKQARRQLGYLPENLAFPQGMSGRELLTFYARLKGADSTEIPILLESVGLTEAVDRRVATYSKGMRQRLGLAQALIGKPRLLLLDEPTNGLDPPLRRHFYETVTALTQKGAGAVLSSHVLSEIEARADLIAILRAGELVAFGPLDELRARSGLPLRLRLRVKPDEVGAVVEAMGRDYDLRNVEGGFLDFACSSSDKMTVVRHVAGLNGAVRDVDILAPPLEDLYTHFVGSKPFGEDMTP